MYVVTSSLPEGQSGLKHKQIFATRAGKFIIILKMKMIKTYNFKVPIIRLSAIFLQKF